MQADLRLAVYCALEEKERQQGIHSENVRVAELKAPATDSPTNNRVLLGLVLDFLKTFKLEATASSLLVEVGMVRGSYKLKRRIRKEPV
jgi:hypothetical protein